MFYQKNNLKHEYTHNVEMYKRMVGDEMVSFDFRVADKDLLLWVEVSLQCA